MSIHLLYLLPITCWVNRFTSSIIRGLLDKNIMTKFLDSMNSRERQFFQMRKLEFRTYQVSAKIIDGMLMEHAILLIRNHINGWFWCYEIQHEFYSIVQRTKQGERYEFFLQCIKWELWKIIINKWDPLLQQVHKSLGDINVLCYKSQ